MSQDIPLHVILVNAIVHKDDKFLIAQRSFKDDQAAGQWSFPGGKVEITDGMGIVEETLKREVLEEVGIEIGDNFVFIGSSAFVRSSGHHVVSLTFVCDYKSGEAQALEDQNAVGWYTLDELEKLDNLPSYTKCWIDPIRKKLDIK